MARSQWRDYLLMNLVRSKGTFLKIPRVQGAKLTKVHQKIIKTKGAFGVGRGGGGTVHLKKATCVGLR